MEDVFGLTDPMVIAIKNSGLDGIFNLNTLTLVQQLTEEVSAYAEVDGDRVISLATEDDIYGNEEGLVVEPFMGRLETRQDAQAVRARIADFPLYLGSLVARDYSMTLIVVELSDDKHAPALYEKLQALVESVPTANGDELYVAGDGAVSGYLITYIFKDASRLVPMSVVIISLLCFVAFRTQLGVNLPGLVIGASASAAMGVMALAGDPIYVITTSMPVLIVGIAVADSIHILSEYYETRRKFPLAEQRELVVTTLVNMWRPVTLTTITSMIGFLGVYFSSYMPPMQAFGLYSMLGLAVAGVFSLIVMPSILVFFKPSSSPVFQSKVGESRLDVFSSFLTFVGHRVLNNSKLILGIALLIVASGIYGAFNLKVNEAWVDNFRKSEDIYIANEQINLLMDGTNNLDVVIEASDIEGLFNPDFLRQIEALQNHMESFSVVGGTSSVADYIKQMHRSLNGDKPEFYTIPDDAELISQYFLLYSASGDPNDFEEEIDYDYRLGLVRARLDSGRYQDFHPVVSDIENYIDQNLKSSDLDASLSGRVYVDYEWLNNLINSHYKGVILALTLVFAVTVISFKSLSLGLLAIVPVSLSTLAIYAFMGVSGITLAVGTTMTAAIALGIGVDFAIHTIDKFRSLIAEADTERVNLVDFYPSTGRALLFNFFAVFIGFGVLGFSYVPPLSKLGILISFAVLVSFISSMTILPALIKELQPRALGFKNRKEKITNSVNPIEAE